MSDTSKVYQADSGDPEMLEAYENARATFRYLWREVMWDRNRIVPALDMAIVKAPFSDGAKAKRKPGVPDVEHMWIGDVDFDGQHVYGVLNNEPNWVKSVKAGDSVQVPLAEISDWLYTISEDAYGGYTVNLLRLRMKKREREEHDGMWGLNFGDPAKVRLAPKDEDSDEHPMSKTMMPSLKEELAKDPTFVSSKGYRGWTLLHHHASAGNVSIVKELLKAGADVNAKTDEGFTPLQLAQRLGWESVAELLTRK